jgi:hypothetical protein
MLNKLKIKKILSFLVLFVAGNAVSQTKLVNDTLFLSSGVTIIKGEQLHFGVGSNMATKGFNFIYTNPASFTAPGMQLGGSWAGRQMLVSDFKYYHRKKTGHKYIVVLRGEGIVRYWCDIEPAIEAKEVIVKEISKNNQAKNSISNMSVADEIRKLNQLKNDSIITEEEFQAQKKKLLDK